MYASSALRGLRHDAPGYRPFLDEKADSASFGGNIDARGEASVTSKSPRIVSKARK